MHHDVLIVGLVKLGIIAIVSLVGGFAKAAYESIHHGWTPVVQEPLHKRAWNRLRGRSSTSVEVRQDSVRVRQKSR